MITVSIVENFNKITGQIAIDEVLDQIQNGFYRPSISPLRHMVSVGDLEGYNKYKKKLVAITPSGLYAGGRGEQYRIGYTGMIVLDIDKLRDEDLPRVKKLVMACNYTFACFVSPSGNGLKVLVRVSTGAEEHKNAFLLLQKFYRVLTGVEIDPSGKDISRLCFVSDDPDLYRNPDSTLFTSEENRPADFAPTPADLPDAPPLNVMEPPVVVPKNPKTPLPSKTSFNQQPPENNDIFSIYSRCIAFTERLFPYVVGHRNDFVFTLSVQLRKAGVAKELTEMLLLQDYNYSDSEVRGTINSVYKYNWPDYTAPRLPLQEVINPLGSESVIPPIPPVEAPNPAANPGPHQPERINPGPKNDEPPVKDVQPPTANEEPIKTKKREKYNIRKVEQLLRHWYETRYNVVTGIIEWRHANTNEPFDKLSDKHEHSMFRNLHHAGQLIPISTLHIILYSDFTPDFNPFTFYFDHLKPWDGVTDYIGQLAATVKTRDDAYWEFCLRKWFVAFAAGLYVDKVINHTVIVLTGGQGKGKTTWMQSILPSALKDYLCTALMQTDSKDSAIQLSECGLITLDELENLNRKELNSLKEFITRPRNRIRRPYGRNMENLPRRASFIASVNYEQILTDLSGSRRYLCSSVEWIDYQHTVDMDGAMAQALALYRSGFKFWFDQEEIRELTLKNEDYMSKSVEEELIETWLRPVTRDEWDHKNLYMNGVNIKLMTSTQIASFMTEKVHMMLCDSMIVKIGKIMQKLGFERIRRGNNYSYMVRVLDQSVVDLSIRQMDSPGESPRYEDPPKNEGEDELPF